ncbi:AAA domain-containing protein [Alcaligenaceae bacterium C4P045]|nr:AAA domain-containing protein [Alcaligenaceae bacterium C4P045]
MNHNSLKLAKYWRNSLADSENGKGALSTSDVKKFTNVSIDALENGRLPESLVSLLFENESEESAHVKITLRPIVYRLRREHGKTRSGMPTYVTPIVCQVAVARDGSLYPTSRALVPRDILEPLDRDSLSIAAQTDLDAFLSAESMQYFEPVPDGEEISSHQHAKAWGEYLCFCRRMFSSVTGGWDGSANGYDKLAFCFLFKEDSPDGVSRNIIALYDCLRATELEVPLFERFAQQAVSSEDACFPPNSLFAGRLAHSGDKFSLAPAQRDALAHLIAGGAGEVLAVNGPPGTGKTTLLLSVVASLWAKAALAGGDPPVIVASSTNNQAVTNVINAFGKDFSNGQGPFAGRWLPDVDSFGAYLPSDSAQAEMAAKYQTKEFFSRLESEDYLAKAQSVYLSQAAAAFPNLQNPIVSEVVDLLQDEIRSRQHQLKEIEDAWKSLCSVREAIRAQHADGLKANIARLEANCQRHADQLTKAQEQLKKFKYYLAHEPLIYTFFNWFGPIAAKRLRLAKLQVDEASADVQQVISVCDIETTLAAIVTQASTAFQQQQALLREAEHLANEEKLRLTQWKTTTAVLPIPGDRATAALTLNDCESLADTSLRFQIFLLTTHYWEGRWLMEVTLDLPEIIKSQSKTGRKTLEKNWRRWMKLTPCVVATFFRLPKEMQCKRHDGTGFVNDYAFNFIDLLIVDEAGQVLPEVAAPSFSLAKQALVIGDTQQIEPIWSIPATVDVGNLVGAGLLSGVNVDEDYAGFCARGHSAANGSVMAIAQAASRYHYDRELARGMYLYEHRRCYNSIIAYCNALCYKGKLQPMRGQEPEGGLPTLGYLHVDGVCRQSSRGSRENLLEAKTIAAWIEANETELKARYKKELWEIVGVISPFGAQTEAIVQACEALGLKAGKGNHKMTVGTVHSFQGAERPVVIFSAVYSKHADGTFIDRKRSMLNVAVSRAKDSFLVFGDMDLFSAAPVSKPRGRLAQFLMANKSSELIFPRQPRDDLHTANTKVEHLHEVDDHDAFLKQTLERADRLVEIVTPWIRLRSMQDSGALRVMGKTVQRGVQVAVYTDLQLNTGSDNTTLHHGDAEFGMALAALQVQRVEVKLVKKVHSKIVMADDHLLCVGSFNWLSAQRNGSYIRHETSMVYRGPDVHTELAINRASLTQRLITNGE